MFKEAMLILIFTLSLFGPSLTVRTILISFKVESLFGNLVTIGLVFSLVFQKKSWGNFGIDLFVSFFDSGHQLHLTLRYA